MLRYIDSLIYIQCADKDYDQSIDIYSMGLIYFEMLYAMDENEKLYIFEQLSQGIFPTAFEASNNGVEISFIKTMLENDPIKRAKANDILIRLLPYNKGMTARVNAIVDQLLPQ